MARLFFEDDPSAAIEELQNGAQVFYIEKGKRDLFEYDKTEPVEFLFNAEQIVVLREEDK
jgi:hypothetical protein